MSFYLRKREEERFLEERELKSAVKINVVGIGGCGNNIISTLYRMGIPAKLIAMNTDASVLRRTECHVRVLLGNPFSVSRGACGSPEIGAKAMEESIDEALNAIDEDVDVVIGIAGLGGGTGTGGLPVFFRELGLRKPNVLKIAVITFPLREEGIERRENARVGFQELVEVSDAIIPNANDILVERVRVLSITEAFRIMDRRVARIVDSLVRLQTPKLGPGIVNVDFSNIQKLMFKAGLCFVGVGFERTIYQAFMNALKDDFAYSELRNAKGAIVMFEGRELDLDVLQIRRVTRYISEDLGIKEVFMGIRPTYELHEVRVSLLVAGITSKYVDSFMGGEGG